MRVWHYNEVILHGKKMGLDNFMAICEFDDESGGNKTGFYCNMDMEMVFNATFNNISFISWRSILLVEGTGVLGEKHRPVASH